MNVPRLRASVFIDDFVSVAEEKQFIRRMGEILPKYFPGMGKARIKTAAGAAYQAYGKYFAALRARGEEILRRAKAEGKPVIVLSGRPYHVDPEINHGIHELICTWGPRW